MESHSVSVLLLGWVKYRWPFSMHHSGSIGDVGARSYTWARAAWGRLFVSRTLRALKLFLGGEIDPRECELKH